MKLSFDENLSFKLCGRLADLFPNSNQVRLANLDAADDRAFWEFAKANGLMIGSQDSDFADMAALWQPNERDHRKDVPRPCRGDHRV